MKTPKLLPTAVLFAITLTATAADQKAPAKDTTPQAPASPAHVEPAQPVQKQDEPKDPTPWFENQLRLLARTDKERKELKIKLGLVNKAEKEFRTEYNERAKQNAKLIETKGWPAEITDKTDVNKYLPKPKTRAPKPAPAKTASTNAFGNKK